MKNKTHLSFAIGTVFAASLVLGSTANAANNPFSVPELNAAHTQLAEGGMKCGSGMMNSKDKKDGKCGSGMQGSDTMKSGKCGSGKQGSKAKDSGKGMKCGSGMQGSKTMKDGKCGGNMKDGKNMSGKGMKDGKCGTGKCGGM